MELPKFITKDEPISDRKFETLVLELDAYRRTLPKKSQPKFLLFLLQMARTAEAKGHRNKSIIMHSLWGTLRNIYITEK